MSPIRWGTGITLGLAEGQHPMSDWYRAERDGLQPNSAEGCGFATRFSDDLALVASIGCSMVRITLDWSRLEPAEGTWDLTAVEHAAAVLSAARAAGLAPWVALHEVAVPGWFVDQGSFTDDAARYSWSRFVDRCADAFGEFAEGWIPLVEPERWARLGHLTGRRPPGRKDPETYAKALRGITIAQRDAWRLLRGEAPVATCWNLAVVEPADGTITAEGHARAMNRLMWDVQVSAQRDGVVDIPNLAIDQVEDLMSSADVVGFTYHGSVATTPEGTLVPYPLGGSPAEDGSTHWPEGLGHVVRRLHDALPNRPVLLAGFGVGTTDDRRRGDLIRATNDVLIDARRDGVEVIGAIYDSTIDGYDWRGGRRVPRGLFDDGRNPKGSALTLEELARS